MFKSLLGNEFVGFFYSEIVSFAAIIVTPQVSRNPRMLHNHTTRCRKRKFRQHNKSWNEYNAEATIDRQNIDALYSNWTTLILTNISKGFSTNSWTQEEPVLELWCISIGCATNPFSHALFKDNLGDEKKGWDWIFSASKLL